MKTLSKLYCATLEYGSQDEQGHHEPHRELHLPGNWRRAAARLQDWSMKDERWKRVVPILASPHKLTRSGRQWPCDACGRHASDG